MIWEETQPARGVANAKVENPASQRSSKCEGLETEARLTHLKRKKEAAVVEEGKREGVGGR